MSFEINKSVKYVGKIDWELKKFHGDELSTHRGSSYNSYLVRDEKIALIDCVWTPFAKEFVKVQRLRFIRFFELIHVSKFLNDLCIER